MNQTPLEILERIKEEQTIGMEKLANARELGGYRMADGRIIRRGRLLRSTALGNSDQHDLRRLKEVYDLRLILDMRTDEDLRRDPDPEIPGVRWVHDPIIDMELLKKSIEAAFQGHAVEAEVFRDPDRMLLFMADLAKNGNMMNAYVTYLSSDFGQKGMAIFFREILKEEEGAILWHCVTGKDRTGLGAAFLLAVLGAEWDTILADYEVSNLFFEKQIRKVEEKLQDKGYDRDTIGRTVGIVAGVHPDLLINAWNYVKSQWGSPIGYLKNAIGITEEDMERLRNRYLE